MVASVFAFAAGIFLLLPCSGVPNNTWVYASCSFFFFLYRMPKIAFFCLGFVWVSVYSNSVLIDRLLPPLEGQDLVVVGFVDGLPQQFDRGVRFNFKPKKTALPEAVTLPSRIRLSWYYPFAKIKTGQEWRLTVRLKRPHGFFNPGGFDYERWLFIQRIGAVGYVRIGDTAVLLESSNHGPKLSRLRQNLDTQLSEILQGSEMVGFVKALSIGSRSEITAAQWKILRTTGTSHLVAISGLHIGLIAGFSFLLFRKLLSFHVFKVLSSSSWAAIAAIAFASIYASLAGFSIPTQRAMIMVCVAMGSIILRRHFKAFRVWVIALLLVLLFDPLAMLSEGFWLSFCAVALILFITSGRLGNTGNWGGLLKIQWITAMGLAPLLILFFQKASLIAPIANLIAVPLVSLIVVPLILFGLLCLFCLPSLAHLTLNFATQIFEFLWSFLQWLSTFPFSEWTHIQTPVGMIVLAMLAIVLLFAPNGFPARWLAVILVLPLIFVDPSRLEKGDFELTLLDVGQGLSMVARTKHHILVYDTGARFSEDFDMGSSVVGPFLRSLGIKNIDTMVISHGDNDHIGGARFLAREFRIERLWTSVPHMIDWHKSIHCWAGESWNWDGVDFRIIGPFPHQTELKENDRSCVLQITGAGGSVLITGDIERTSENLLVQKYGSELHSQILIVPHHGSNTSSTRSFLDRVKPQYALISAGYRNRYGFPRQQVRGRLNRMGAIQMNTAETGAIKVVIDAENGVLEPEAYRNVSGHFWNWHQ